MRQGAGTHAPSTESCEVLPKGFRLSKGHIPAKRCVPTPPPSGVTEPVSELLDHTLCVFWVFPAGPFKIFSVNLAIMPLLGASGSFHVELTQKSANLYLMLSEFNPLKPELNPICCLLALLGAHHFLHVSRIRVKLLTFRLLMSYMYIWSTHSWCF